jgi:hypothetical protein
MEVFFNNFCEKFGEKEMLDLIQVGAVLNLIWLSSLMFKKT